MSGFVSQPRSATAADAVQGDAFWPTCSVAALRDTARLDTSVTDARARDAIIAAMVTVRRDLALWQAEQLVLGRTRLVDVPLGEVAGKDMASVLYERAVYSFAAAELVETHHDISATSDGRERNAERALASDDHRRNGLLAIRDILGVTRTSVGLI